MDAETKKSERVIPRRTRSGFLFLFLFSTPLYPICQTPAEHFENDSLVFFFVTDAVHPSVSTGSTKPSSDKLLKQLDPRHEAELTLLPCGPALFRSN